MTIRKTWNLWRMLILPGGLAILFFIGLNVSTINEFNLPRAFLVLLCTTTAWIVWYEVILSSIIPKKCKCPKCEHPLMLHKCLKLSAYTFTGWYWPPDLKLKCSHCGQLLNENGD